jgi:hypothetical protein
MFTPYHSFLESEWRKSVDLTGETFATLTLGYIPDFENDSTLADVKDYEAKGLDYRPKALQDTEITKSGGVMCWKAANLQWKLAGELKADGVVIYSKSGDLICYSELADDNGDPLRSWNGEFDVEGLTDGILEKEIY